MDNDNNNSSSNNSVGDNSQYVKVGEGVKFERLRRITGYLVGTVDRWNDGKRAELTDREVHTISEVNYDKSSTPNKK